LVGASGWGEEPGIFVNSGGSLEIDTSEIVGGDFDGPISIFVEQGGKIIIKNSTLHNVGWASGTENGLTLGGDGAVIDNNIFDGCYSAIFVVGSGHHQIINNTIRNGQFGIVMLSQDNTSTIKDNTISDIVYAFSH
jgi:parallel beta-helix repeat protein